MNKIKSGIIISIVILIILIIAIIIVNNFMVREDIKKIGESDSFYVNTNLVKEENVDMVNNISTEMVKYFTYIKNKDENGVNSLLDNEYKNSRAFNLQNLLEDSYNNYISIDEAYAKDDYIYPVYYLKVNVQSEEFTKTKNEYFCFFIDYVSTSYSIIPITETDYDKVAQQKIELYSQREIQRNEYNEYDF